MSDLKPCADKQCKQTGQELSLSKFPRDRTKKDKRYIYCLECCRRRVTESRRKKGVQQRAFKALTIARKPMAAKSPSVEIVKAAIESGLSTRNKIRGFTRLPWDQITESLVQLVFDEQTVRIERVGELAYFVAA